MKNRITLIVLVVFSVLGIAAVSTNRFGIVNGFLQNDFDGNQKNITNVNAITSANYFLVTNALSLWPAQAVFPGAAAFVNSNGTVFLLTSAPGSLAWAATNKLAP